MVKEDTQYVKKKREKDDKNYKWWFSKKLKNKILEKLKVMDPPLPSTPEAKKI